MSFDEYSSQNRDNEAEESQRSVLDEGRTEKSAEANAEGIKPDDAANVSSAEVKTEQTPFRPLDFSWDTVEPPRPPKKKRERRAKNPKESEASGSNKGLKIFSIVVSCVLVITLGAFGFVLTNHFNEGDAIAQGSSASQEAPSREDAPSLIIGQTPDASSSLTVTDGPLTIPQIAAKVKPSVVGIITYTKESGLQAASEGSGIVMTSDGYIITNEHVIDGADAVKVVLENGDEFEATVIGADTRTDLAVIKIQKNNLTAAQFGDSSKLVTGETVVAIGNPGGMKYAGSVTQGIVSATNRLVSATADSGYTLACIQTDAAINPGNSGGALVNIYGQVIGINSSKIVATGFEGIGFSISINEAKPIIDDLLNYGYVKNRVKIGISVTPIDEVLAKMYGIPQGLRVVAIESTSDAVSKGLQVGDIITKVDGTQMTAFSDLSAILKAKKADDTIVLDVYRQTSGSAGRSFSVTLKLREDRGVQVDQSTSNG